MDIFSSKSVNSVVDAVINTGDTLVYTDEEKAQAEQLKVETKLKMLPMYGAFKLAQRYLAFAFTGSFLVVLFIGVGTLFLGTKEQLDGLLQLVSTFQLGWIVTAVVSFYFSGGLVNSFKSKGGK